MREIKFRAWNGEEMICIGDERRWGFVTNIFLVTNYKDNLMQFTGLKDKNGVEIYEGDIVKWTDWRKNSDGSVTLSKVNEYERRTEIKYKTKGIFIGYTIHDFYEVIGNIHQSPELLEKDKTE